ncbi:MAG: type II toxin-antitoxin system mRNA interferase toxin, RelE/StbE family [bacterium]|nr:type II toxin-antitoxin system mRNA interferase toxin, RelE/StbE family [bacterium]
MTIRYHRRFDRKFRALPLPLREKTITTIERFTSDPHNPQLRNHQLRGRLVGLRAITVVGDLRIIFEEHRGYALVLFLDIGTHERVYG